MRDCRKLDIRITKKMDKTEKIAGEYLLFSLIGQLLDFLMEN